MAIIAKDGQGNDRIFIELPGGIEEHHAHIHGIVKAFTHLKDDTPIGEVAQVLKLLEKMLPDEPTGKT